MLLGCADQSFWREQLPSVQQSDEIAAALDGNGSWRFIWWGDSDFRA